MGMVYMLIVVSSGMANVPSNFAVFNTVEDCEEVRTSEILKTFTSECVKVRSSGLYK